MAEEVQDPHESVPRAVPVNQRIRGLEQPFPLQFVALSLVFAAAVGMLVLLLGANQINGVAHALPSDRAYDDGVLTNVEVDALVEASRHDDLAAASATLDRPGNRCVQARATYETLLDGGKGLGYDRPNSVVMPDSRYGTCTVFDEQRSGAAAISILVGSALAASATLVGLLLSAMAATRIKRYQDWLLGVVFAVLITAAGYGLLGKYQGESHHLVILATIFFAVTPGTATLVKIARVDPASFRAIAARPCVDVGLTRIRTYRLAVRATVIILSGLFALAVIFMSSLNERHLAIFEQASVPLPTGVLGGLGEDRLALLTALQGFGFALVLGVLAVPALVNVERLAYALIDAASSDTRSEAAPTRPVTPTSWGPNPSMVRAKFRAALDRSELGTDLGITSGPAQWFEQSLAVLLPVLTGVFANSIGVFS